MELTGFENGWWKPTVESKAINFGHWANGGELHQHTPGFFHDHSAGTFHYLGDPAHAVKLASEGIKPLTFKF